MFKYSETLTELQQQIKLVELNDLFYCLSVYLPFDQESQTSSMLKVVSTKFKSLVETAVEKQLPLPEQKQLRLAITDSISMLSSTFDMTKEGVCVYATFHTGAQYRGNNKKDLDQELIPFIQAVPLFTLFTKKSSAYVGKVFDVIPLLDNINFDNQSLVIDVHKDEALLYEFTQMQLKLLSRVQNSYIKFPEREEYLDQNNGNHSNRKDFNYEEDYLHQFLRDDLTVALTSYAGNYKTLVIVYPQQYKTHISNFSNQIASHFSEIQTLSLTTNKTSELLYSNLSEMVKKQIQDSREVTKKELNSHSKKLQTDSKIILEAAKKGQVETVYVAPYYNTLGFVNNDDNTSKNYYNDLDIIQNVVNFNGNVIVISTDLLDKDKKSKTIFTTFRY